MRGINGMNLTRMRSRLGMVSSFARPRGRGNFGERKIIQSKSAIIMKPFEPKPVDLHNISLSDLEIDEAAVCLSRLNATKAADILRDEDLGGKLTAEILNRIAIDKREEIMDEMDLELYDDIRNNLIRSAVAEMDTEEIVATLRERGKEVSRYRSFSGYSNPKNVANNLLFVLQQDEEDHFSLIHREEEKIEEYERKNGPKSEAKIFEEMNLGSAIRILESLPLKREIQIIDAMRAEASAKILLKMSAQDAADILDVMRSKSVKKVEILHLMDFDYVVKLLCLMKSSCDIIAAMHPSDIEKIFSKVIQPDKFIFTHDNDVIITKAAVILSKIDAEKAANILKDRLQVHISHQTLQRGTSWRRILSIFEKMPLYKAVNILAKVEPAILYEILGNMNPKMAALIILELSRPDLIISKMDCLYSGAILAKMDLSNAIKMLDSLSLSQQTQMLSLMDNAAASNILNNMLSNNSFKIFKKMEFPKKIQILNDPNISDEKVMEILSCVDPQAELFNELDADRMVRIAQMGFVPNGI